MNVTKIMGYIPLIGILSAITRPLFARLGASLITDPQAKTLHSYAWHLRGALEFLGLGLLLLIPDFIVTAYRAFPTRNISPDTEPA